MLRHDAGAALTIPSPETATNRGLHGMMRRPLTFERRGERRRKTDPTGTRTDHGAHTENAGRVCPI